MDQILDMLGPIVDTIKGLVGEIDITSIIETIKGLIGGIIGG